MLNVCLRRSVGAAALVSALALSGQSFADDAKDAESRQETVVVTGTVGSFGATKSDTPITETARSVTVEPAALFIDKGALTLSQTVTYAAGVTGETYGFATR